jgi:succinoglycan biosynthesis protein ExoA
VSATTGMRTFESEASRLPIRVLPSPAPRRELVSVIIPARNEEAAIGACLDSVLAQGGPTLEAIVVVSPSGDRTADIVRERIARDARVRLIEPARSNIPKALNLALGAARGRWLVRVDAHSTIPPGYIRWATSHLRTGLWGGVGGRKDGVGKTPAGRAIAAAMASRFGVGNSTYHHGTEVQRVDHVPFGAYPTEVVRELGGWDERLDANEDFEFDHRLRATGRDLLFDPALQIRWECRQSILGLYRQYGRYGRAKVRVALLHPDSFRRRHMAPPALVVGLAAAAAVSPWTLAPIGAVGGAYLSAVVAASAVTAGRLRGDPASQIRLPFAFLAMHLGWGWGFWKGVGAELKRLVGPK